MEVSCAEVGALEIVLVKGKKPWKGSKMLVCCPPRRLGMSDMFDVVFLNLELEKEERIAG